MVKAVVGANWGDEGKGKITDMLAEQADIIVRFQGGANAGHTIINDYGKFALHTLPSGVFYGHTTSIIGNGVALDVPVLFKEVQSIIDQGVPMPKILVSDRAQMVMSYHKNFDAYEEERLGGKSFGSTKSGIAPFYSDKYAKIGFQVSELFDDELLKEKVVRVAEQKNVLLEHLYHKPLINPDDLYNELQEYKKMIEPFVCDTSLFLNNAIKEGKEVLLEGQLGSLKDPDHGIYPMVTSSSTLAGYGAIGAGIPPYEIKKIVTVCKAYSSAVGAGAFVSEIFGDEADELRRRGGDGGEFGATTGRPRRMGWFDCVASKYGCRMQGTTDVAFTVLDVLGYLDEIPVCVGYDIDGEVTTDFPTTHLLEKAKPVLYDFVSDDGIRHRVWKIDDPAQTAAIEAAFAAIPATYIADGHHRAASAVKVGLKRRAENPGYTGEEPFNYFLSVLFPDEELMILPYNRVVKDLNGMSREQFFEAVKGKFELEEIGKEPYAPVEKGTFGMYLDNTWYALKVLPQYRSADPVKGLDVSILQDQLLGPVLGIGDPRTDKRIDFIGGIRGLKELERRVREDMEIAFSMYPTSIEELLAVADAGLLMPPKSTWFEPKLRSGLFIHKLS